MNLSPVTVVIVNRKTRKLTEDCLTTLLEFYPRISVILVDNWSGKDSSLDYVKYADETYPNVNALYITSGEPHHARGLNLAAKNITTLYFLTLDSDVTILRGGWIEKMLRAFDSPDLFAIGHLCRNANSDCSRPPMKGEAKYSYIHPFCAMWSRIKYDELGTKFVYTGQPACAICIKAERMGYRLANMSGIHPHNVSSVPLYVHHVWGGTRTRLAVLADQARKEK